MFSERLVGEVKTLESLVVELLSIISILPDRIQILRKRLLENGHGNDSNYKTTKQIGDLIAGIDSYNQNVVTSHANLSAKLMQLDQLLSRSQLSRSIDGTFFHLASDLQNIVERLKLKSNEVYSLLERNQKLGSDVKRDINNASRVS